MKMIYVLNILNQDIENIIIIFQHSKFPFVYRIIGSAYSYIHICNIINLAGLLHSGYG